MTNTNKFNVEKIQEGTQLTLKLKGHIDTTNANQFEALLEDLEGVTELILDLQDLVYLYSAGLRVVLLMQRKMNKNGTMKVIHVQPSVMDIFEVTGFVEILTIEA